MTLRSLLLCLLLSGSSLVSIGQDLFDFYHVDTAQAKPICVLPHLYFSSSRSTSLTKVSEEDLLYLVSLLEAHPNMHLRLRGDGEFRRFDRKQNHINRRRLKKVANVLVRRHDIDRQRLVLIPREPWSYRSAKEAPPHELVARRLACDCVWKKSKDSKVQPFPEDAPSGDANPFAPINAAEVAKQ